MIVLKAKTAALKRKVSNVAVCVEKKKYQKENFRPESVVRFLPINVKGLE